MSSIKDNRPDIAQAFRHLTQLYDMRGATSQDAMIAAARRALELYGEAVPRAPLSDIAVKPLRIGSLDGEWLLPPQAKEDARILYLHGGSMLAGSLHSYRPIAAELARQSGCPVLVIAYRLAPEHVFPAAHEDCAAAYDWLRGNGPAGARPAKDIFLVGDSAGGNLVAALCARIIAENSPPPTALALLCPCLDYRDNPGRPARPTDPLINNNVVGGIALYAAATPRTHPHISALLTPDAVLGKFPPTLIQVGSGEYLRDDAEAFTARLAALDRRTLLSIWPGMPHVWHAFQTLLPEAKAALAEAAAFLANAAER